MNLYNRAKLAGILRSINNLRARCKNFTLSAACKRELLTYRVKTAACAHFIEDKGLIIQDKTAQLAEFAVSVC